MCARVVNFRAGVLPRDSSRWHHLPQMIGGALICHTFGVLVSPFTYVRTVTNTATPSLGCRWIFMSEGTINPHPHHITQPFIWKTIHLFAVNSPHFVFPWFVCVCFSTLHVCRWMCVLSAELCSPFICTHTKRHCRMLYEFAPPYI